VGECVTLFVVNLGTRWGWVVSLTLHPLYLQGEILLYTLNSRFGWPECWSVLFGVKVEFLLMLGNLGFPVYTQSLYLVSSAGSPSVMGEQRKWISTWNKRFGRAVVGRGQEVLRNLWKLKIVSLQLSQIPPKYFSRIQSRPSYRISSRSILLSYLELCLCLSCLFNYHVFYECNFVQFFTSLCVPESFHFLCHHPNILITSTIFNLLIMGFCCTYRTPDHTLCWVLICVRAGTSRKLLI